MPIGRKRNKYGVALDKPCVRCGTWEKLTRHHIKDLDGIKTGVISILCRPCHDDVEEEYKKEGRLGRHPSAFDMYTIGKKTRLTSISNVDNDRLRPYYTIGKDVITGK